MDEVKERIKWIDVAKGIGIILVVIGHISRNEYLNYFIYSFHMPLFFMLSGYLYKEKEYFVERKVKSILIPYFIFSFLSFLYWYIIERNLRQQANNPIDVFINILLARGGEENYIFNAVMWFLPCLFMVELVFYLLQTKIRGKNKQLIILLIMIICGILGFIYPRITTLRLPFCIDTMLTAIVFYYMGYKLKNKINFIQKNIKDRKKLTVIILGLFVMTIILAMIERGINLNNLKYDSFILLYLTAIIGTSFICMLSNCINNNCMNWLGKNSLYIMCLHNQLKE